jgi:hypothetical protein
MLNGADFFLFLQFAPAYNIIPIVLFRSLARYRIFVFAYYFPHLTKY